MNNIASPLSRRALLTASVAAGGGLMIGFSFGAAAQQKKAPVPSAFVRIASTGAITLIVPYVEMGQGAYTAQVQILAEELEVDPLKVLVEAAPANEALYSSPIFGGQITGGSGSLRGAWMTMRAAGAAARMMLVNAAAQEWKVSATECAAAAGEVTHKPSGKRLPYGRVADAAARLPVPAEPVLKSVKDYKVVGKAIPRLEGTSKVDGTAKFGMDVMLPGMRIAAVMACPIINGTVDSVDDRDALKVRGVSQIVRLPNAVAVVASNSWAARKGLAALHVSWRDGANATLGTADLVAKADAALERAGIVSTKVGDVAQAEAQAGKAKYEAVFRLPMLAHAAMEPLSCTVHATPDKCEIWLGSQILGRAHKIAATALGLPPEKVVMHNHFLGGGFGRRLEVDYVEQAALIAKQVSGPVKVMWSREEDMRHDYFRYHNHSRITVALDAKGMPTSWRHKVVGPNIMDRFLPIYQKDGVDLDIVDCAAGPYDVANVHIEYVRDEAPTGLATGNWRGVGPTRNVCMVESVIDDLAHRANRDPLDYRRALMTRAPRVRAAMELAAAKAGWGEKLPARTGRGLATFEAFGSYLGMIAQVHVTPKGQIVVERVVCAVDTGIVVNPDIVRAQIEGGIIFGISAALYGRVTVAKGRVEQANFNDYRVVRMNEAPHIDVHIVESTADPGGVGEPGTSGAIAAVANGVFAATGKRVYTLPLATADLREGA